jgi:hypothetical protein
MDHPFALPQNWGKKSYKKNLIKNLIYKFIIIIIIILKTHIPYYEKIKF